MKLPADRLVVLLLSAACAGLAVLTAGCGQSAQSTEASASEAVTADAAPSALQAGAIEPAGDSGEAAVDRQAREASSTGNGMEAIEKAAEAGEYLFAFFWKEDDENTKAMRSVFDAALKDFANRAQAVVVKITEPEQEEIVEQFGLDRAPMPIVLALAPNGAITGGFPNSFTASDLEGALVSSGAAQCVKSLQESKLVLLCVQNDETESSEEAMKGVREFKDSQEYPEFVEIVKLDPNDSEEAKFLGELQISADTETAVTVMMAPPGVPIGVIEGPTTKELFADLLSKAQSACAGGQCGPGGCGPPAQ